MAFHLRAAHAGAAMVAVLAAILLVWPHVVVSSPRNVEHFAAMIRLVRALAFAYLSTTAALEVYLTSDAALGRSHSARLIALAGHLLVLCATAFALLKGPRSVGLLTGLAVTLTEVLTMSAIATIVSGLEVWLARNRAEDGSAVAGSGLYRLVQYACFAAAAALAAALVNLEMQPLPS